MVTVFDMTQPAATYLFNRLEDTLEDVLTHRAAPPREIVTSHGNLTWIMTVEVAGYALNEMPNLIWTITVQETTASGLTISGEVWIGPHERTRKMLYEVARINQEPVKPLTPENYGSW